MQIHANILCGGSGTRLWPLSRTELPKQFVPLIDNKTLLQMTIERVSGVAGRVTCIASDTHRFLLEDAVRQSEISCDFIYEPVGRNTAAAMAIGALNANAEDLLLFLPADHHIPDAALFCETILNGVDAARQGKLVTFGVVPNLPSTAYGYIECARDAVDQIDKSALALPVRAFVEKPALPQAEKFLRDGGYFWNAGIFLTRADTLLAEMEQHAPDILASCREAFAGMRLDGASSFLPSASFSACRSQSIDYAVMERSIHVVMVRFSGDWSDVGSWNAVAELNEADEQGNRLFGKAQQFNARNTFIHAPHRCVVALGTQDLLIVDTADALLVAHAKDAERVKDVVGVLGQQGHPVVREHRHAKRPWGKYESIDRGERFQVKRITVNPGGKLSLQLHHHRAEHWIVVSGIAKVTCGEDVFFLKENQSTYIPLGVKHRLENPGDTLLDMIEVQSGSYLGEDDIVRFDDSYGRADPLAPLPLLQTPTSDKPADPEIQVSVDS